MCAGQAALQGDVPLLSMDMALGIACGYLLNIAFRVASPSSNSLATLTGHTATQSPQELHLVGSINLGFLWIRALKSPSWPSSASSSALVIISMLGCLPTSISLGEIMHMEQSLVGKVLSNWAILPPMDVASSTRYTLKPELARSKANS